MFKTEEQINERLNSSKNLVNRFANISRSEAPAQVPPTAPVAPPHEIPTENITVIPLNQPGNKEKPKLSSEHKNEIAIRARLGEGQTKLAMEFGVSQSAIGEIEQGRTRVDEKHVQQKMDEVHDVAMDKLLSSLGFITPEKMEKSKATDLSMIASNMSKVIGNIRGKEMTGPQVTVQIYAPELKNESSFKSIDV